MSSFRLHNSFCSAWCLSNLFRARSVDHDLSTSCFIAHPIYLDFSLLFSSLLSLHAQLSCIRLYLLSHCGGCGTRECVLDRSCRRYCISPVQITIFSMYAPLHLPNTSFRCMPTRFPIFLDDLLLTLLFQNFPRYPTRTQTNTMEFTCSSEPSHMGRGTYPRATRLQDGSILGTHTEFQDWENVIVTTRSIDDGMTWVPHGEVRNYGTSLLCHVTRLTSLAPGCSRNR